MNACPQLPPSLEPTEPPIKLVYSQEDFAKIPLPQNAAAYMWRSEFARPRRNNSLVNLIDAKVKGAPVDPDVQSLLAPPSGPSGDRASKIASKAMTTSFFGARGPNRAENDRWFVTVPNDFWG